jgi:hypothetical protein
MTAVKAPIMKKSKLYIAASCLIFSGCHQPAAKANGDQEVEEVTAEVVYSSGLSLQTKWESEASLITNESVLYDPQGEVLFVSCINGMPTDVDGNGYIAKLGLDGSVIESKWASGFNAPKGMCIFDGRLYFSDISKVYSVALANPKDRLSYEVPGAVFLNDLAAGNRGVYISDMKTGMLHYLEDNTVHTINTSLPNLNGLAFRDDQLFALSADGLLRLSEGGEVKETINTKVTGGDGLIPLGNNRFLASRWQGELWIIDGVDAELLLDSKANEIQTADIGFNPMTNTLYVPRFFTNTVSAFEVSGL